MNRIDEYRIMTHSMNKSIQKINHEFNSDIITKDGFYALTNLEEMDNDFLEKLDNEADKVLNRFEDGLSCFDYREITSAEIAKELKGLDNPSVITSYMKELKSPYVLEVYQCDNAKYEYTMEYMDFTLLDYIKKNIDKAYFSLKLN